MWFRQIVLIVIIVLCLCGYIVGGNTGLQCDDGEQHIKRAKWCDGSEDCNDGSDESYCITPTFFSPYPNKCDPVLHFMCIVNKICIPVSAKCDKVEDCSDGTDESDCEKSSSSSKETDSSSDEEDSSSGEEEDDEEEDEKNKAKHKKDEENQVEYEKKKEEESTTVVHQTDIPEFSTMNGNNGNKEWNYSNELISYDDTIARAVNWLMSVRDLDTGWGEDTARALITLGLTRPDLFTQQTSDVYLMKKQLQNALILDLMREKDNNPLSISRLSLYINALIMTCQDPRNFFGTNLVQELRNRVLSMANPIGYFTLCLMNQTISRDFYNLRHILITKKTFHESDIHWQDMRSLAIIAMSCIVNSSSFAKNFSSHLVKEAEMLRDSISMKEDSIKNIYSTALAVQALQSVKNLIWNPEHSLSYLKSHQLKNGSFGDVLATYYVLPALTRKNLYNIREQYCWKQNTDNGGHPLLSLDYLMNVQKPWHHIRFEVRFGFPNDKSYNLVIKVRKGTNFFDIMRIAAHMNPNFRFSYENRGNRMEVYSIGGVPNDAERGMYWKLYTIRPNFQQREKLYTSDIRNLILQENDIGLFWYKQE